LCAVTGWHRDHARKALRTALVPRVGRPRPPRPPLYGEPELTDGRGADVVITATAANIAQEQAIRMAARRGRISFFGGLPQDRPVHLLRLETSCTTTGN
jgi:threonine dehydrogenase-like Zn-dependent dehydrogenase